MQSSSLPQYLGDLTENSPLPFSIPIEIKPGTEKGKYLTNLKISYKDDLRTEHDLILNQTVNFKPVEGGQTNLSDNSSSILGFNTSNFVITLIAILSILIVIAILVVLVTIKKRKNKKSKFYKSLKNQDNNIDHFLGDKKDE